MISRLHRLVGVAQHALERLIGASGIIRTVSGSGECRVQFAHFCPVIPGSFCRCRQCADCGSRRRCDGCQPRLNCAAQGATQTAAGSFCLFGAVRKIVQPVCRIVCAVCGVVQVFGGAIAGIAQLVNRLGRFLNRFFIFGHAPLGVDDFALQRPNLFSGCLSAFKLFLHLLLRRAEGVQLFPGRTDRLLQDCHFLA